MGKVRRKQPAGKTGLKSVIKRNPKTAVSVFSEEATNFFDKGINSKPNLSKKLKRKIKHDDFVKKLSKPSKLSKPETLNLKQMRDSLSEISFDTVGNSSSVEASAPKSNPFFNPIKVITKKQRNKTKRKEMERFNQVINYSVFKNDPLKVIQLHLSNTIKASKPSN